MTLHLHRAERADRLVEALGELLLDPLHDPMIPEIVSVPTRGVERWITQQLSNVLGASPGRRDGACANIDFPFPGRLIGAALAKATDADPTTDVWAPERLVWPLLDVVEGCLDEPWLATLAGYLRSDENAADRRFGAVRHIANLFNHYTLHRPTMVRSWNEGDDSDGHSRSLPSDGVWQAELWRRLRVTIGTLSPAERLPGGCERIRLEPTIVALPPRFALFGLTRLPVSHLEVLQALAAHRDVHLYLLHPSPVLWDEIARSTLAGVVPRSRDATTSLPTNPLLRSWGRDARELQLVVSDNHDNLETHHHAVDVSRSTLLNRMQADIHADRAPDPSDRPVLDPGDRSLQVHSCHGQARQVEVLRDAILHLFEDDPTLEPRDVIVMCPDIETFAPLIHATFGSEASVADLKRDGDRSTVAKIDLRVRLADRSLRQTNPVLAAISDLLMLADERLTASQLLGVASCDAVRRRFEFDDEDLARLEEWVSTAGIRWGLDGDHRATYGLDNVEANTWKSGLDRILIGATTPEDDLTLVGDVLPLDDVASGDLDLVGRFAEFVERLGEVAASFRRPHTVIAWADTIGRAAGLLTAVDERDGWQMLEFRRLLEEVAVESEVEGRPFDEELSVAEVRALLGQRLEGRPTRANFRTGHLTVCTLFPMRSVPHRVVCLLGLDDGAFPRRTTTDGDDLLARSPCVGDRDPRSEDRQLLLDAILAARDHLLITYCGRDERTNLARPPAVPVWELLDVADSTCQIGGDGHEAIGTVREHIVTEHPLQPFDASNYTPDALGAPGVWSFDLVNLAGARAANSERVSLPPFLPGPLPDHPLEVIELDDLIRFLRHPMRSFLRQRLGLVLVEEDSELADAMSIELDGLQRWKVGQRLLDALLAGADAATCRAAELARGDLPPGVLGENEIDALLSTTDRLVRAVTAACPDYGTNVAVEAEVVLPSGISVAGTVTDVVGDTILSVTYSQVAAQHRLAAWVKYLLLTSASPETPYRAVTIGRGSRGRLTKATIAPLHGEGEVRRVLALELLDNLCELARRGRREPLPIFCKTSAAYAAAVAAGRSAVGAVSKEWDSTGKQWDVEDRDLEHRLILGDDVSVDDLLGWQCSDDEARESWPTNETGRFGRYARRLWDPLLAHEEVDES